MNIKESLQAFFGHKPPFEGNADVHAHAGDVIIGTFLRWHASLSDEKRKEVIDVMVDDFLSDAPELSSGPEDVGLILDAIAQKAPVSFSASTLDYLESELQRVDLINAWRRELDSKSEPDVDHKKVWRYGNLLWGILYRTRREAACAYLDFVERVDVSGNLLRELATTRDVIDGVFLRKWGL